MCRLSGSISQADSIYKVDFDIFSFKNARVIHLTLVFVSKTSLIAEKKSIAKFNIQHYCQYEEYCQYDACIAFSLPCELCSMQITAVIH